MRAMILGFAVVLAFSSLIVNAHAQDGCACTASGSYSVGTVASGGSIGGSAVSSSAGQGRVFPYSYYVSSPSRIYVPYGPNDQFPFYGQPYGSPNDRWSWNYMGGSTRSLARYYFPPLR
jgi:hypothetical protein